LFKGPISYLHSVRANASNDDLLFVGGKDGRVKLFRITWDHEKIEAKDLGYIWEEKGENKISKVFQVSH
jgi:hypothetical protein